MVTSGGTGYCVTICFLDNAREKKKCVNRTSLMLFFFFFLTQPTVFGPTGKTNLSRIYLEHDFALFSFLLWFEFVSGYFNK